MGINLEDAFFGWLQRQLPNVSNLELTDSQLPSSGQSAETLLFSIHYDDENANTINEKLVLRSGPQGSGTGIFPSYDLGLQVGIMQALQPSPVPVPEVRWYETDKSIIGSAFVVMEFIEGDVPSDIAPGFHGQGLFFEASAEEQRSMWRLGIEQMAVMHQQDWRALDLPPLQGAAPGVTGVIQGQVDLLQSWIDYGDMHDIELIQKGMHWLRTTPIPCKHTSLVWGDARPGNIIYRQGVPVSLLDWELAHIGIPEYDLFYWWWSSESLAEYNNIERIPTLPDKQETISMYEAALGRPITATADYTETLSLVRFAIMNLLGMRAATGSSFDSIDAYLNMGIFRELQSRID